MKYILIAFLSIIFLLALAPVATEMQFNRLSSEKEVFVSEKTKAFHENIFIADLHSDSLLWSRNLRKASYRGHVDMPRLRIGNVAFQYFTVVTKSPKGLNIHANSGDTDSLTLFTMLHLWPIKTWFSLFERAKHQANRLQKYIDKDPFLMLIKNKQDLLEFARRRENDDRWLAVSLGLEGAHAIEDDIEKHFEVLVELGFTMMAPVHLFDNKISGSMQGLDKGGLTEEGRYFVSLANDYNVSIDLAHASIAAVEDVLRLSNKPLIVSHTGLKGHCDNNRNLPDDLARAIVSKGGIIGIGFWPFATCGKEADDIVDAITYAVKLLGENAVALGSDYDGAVRVPFTTDKMTYLSQRLLDAGLKEQVVKKIMGENVLRFLSKNLPK